MSGDRVGGRETFTVPPDASGIDVLKGGDPAAGSATNPRRTDQRKRKPQAPFWRHAAKAAPAGLVATTGS